MGNLRVINDDDRARSQTRTAILQDLHTMVTTMAHELMRMSLRVDALQADVARLQQGEVVTPVNADKT